MPLSLMPAAAPRSSVAFRRLAALGWGLVLFAALFAGAAAAQTGKIQGTVTEAGTGEPLPGVTVIIEGLQQGAATDLDGNYVVIGVRPGTYTVRASYVGFQPVSVQEVRVRIDLTTEVDFELSEQVIEGEEVVVTAERELIQRDVTATTSFVSGEEIRAIPVENFDDVVELQAGVVDGHFRGGRTGEVAYWVDGLPVTDVYDGGRSVEIENASVEELQVVTGAFNAEYGQALSGIVNVVTRDGGNEFDGQISAFTGDYLSGGSDTFRDLGGFRPGGVLNVQGDVSGPILQDRLTFFTSGRYFRNEGWIIGRDVFRPEDVGVQSSGRIGLLNAGGSGDSSAVSLNPYERFSGQAKLTYRLGSGSRLAANVLLSQEDFRGFSPNLFFAPATQRQQRQRGLTAYLKLTQILSNTTFFDLGVTGIFNNYETYLYEDPLDARYLDNDLSGFTNPLFATGFTLGGTDNGRFERTTQTFLVKADLSSQVNSWNLLKAGVEARLHELSGASTTTVVEEAFDPVAGTRERTSAFLADNGTYTRRPIEFAAYLQDKIEIGGLVINAGLRLDYFNSNGEVLIDPTDPNAVFLENRIVQRDANGNPVLDADGNPVVRTNPDGSLDYTPSEFFRSTEGHFAVSPRLGVAFPISEGGVMHFSFGQFFQVPSFELLYGNPYFLLGSGGSGLIGLINNAELAPEQTISGEIGLKQELSSSSAVEVTAYYRDIRNLTGTATDPILIEGTSARYGRFVNSDFGFVRGIILRFDQRIGQRFFAGVDYTFQVARANSSDPAQVYNAAAARQDLPTQIVPTSWDQRHTANFSLTYDNPAIRGGFGLVATYGSGQPYTPARTTLQTGVIVPSTIDLNSEIKPSEVNVNLSAYKRFRVYGETEVEVFARADNLLDARNELGVFGDTGRATYSLQQNVDARSFQGPAGFLEQAYRRPDFFNEPRRVIVGLRYSF